MAALNARRCVRTEKRDWRIPDHPLSRLVPYKAYQERLGTETIDVREYPGVGREASPSNPRSSVTVRLLRGSERLRWWARDLTRQGAVRRRKGQGRPV